jgi:serine/threonine protein kinase
VTEEGHACLADFGLSVIGDATRTRMPTTADARGATPWLAPELLSEDIHAPRKTLAGDVFAFGRLCLAVGRILDYLMRRLTKSFVRFAPNASHLTVYQS